MDGGRAHLGFSTLILAALGAALALAGPGGAAPSATEAGRPIGPAELERIAVAATPAVARGVEQVRGLEFRELPEPEVVTSEYLNRLGTRELERRDDRLGLAADDAFGRITGLLAADEDLGGAYESTGDLAAAAYDPRTERLYVVSDAIVANRALVEFVLAHELNHALEDQRFELRDSRRLDDDGALASQALTEGTATAVMTEFAARYLDPLDLLAAAGSIDEGTAEVPEVLIDQLTWTYVGGERFVAELRDLAGSWKLVDFALSERPPASTEQVLHPRKYVVDERPSAVRINPETLEARGWRRADRNVLGELATSLLLEVGADAADARIGAAGWDGDRYELWRREAAPSECEHPCRRDLVVVAGWRWDTVADRQRFTVAAVDYVHGGLDAEPVGDRLWRVEDGFVAIAGRREQSAIVFAPAAGLARTVASAHLDAN